MPKQQAMLQVKTKVKLEPLVVQSAVLDQMLEERLITAAKYSQAKARADALEAKKQKLDANILKLAKKKTGNDDQGIETTEYVVTPVNSESNYIIKEELMKLGVRLSVIDKATKKTPYTYARITKKKAPVVVD